MFPKSTFWQEFSEVGSRPDYRRPGTSAGKVSDSSFAIVNRLDDDLQGGCTVLAID